ncbi:hypothetical protein ACLGIH_02560 [Streptomyces sp. HMX87]|uniref:hypothetical protein n=1 Tax=Streptomyces sp. HMX87 TaxID=3390849 RepID=UPI003A89F34A
MPESTARSTELSSQYAAQVTGDLERNTKEQERIAEEIADLQRQLAELQHDHALLVAMQQALGAAPAVADGAVVPAPRTRAAEESRQGKRTRAGKPGTRKPAVETPAVKSPARKGSAGRTSSGKASSAKAPSGKASSVRKAGARKSAAEKPASARQARPTLVALVRDHLAGQQEPRSAAEVAAALGQEHPERGIKANVVRTTLEGLVAKNQAQRTKQGTSVYYTASEAAQSAPDTAAQAAPDAAQSAPETGSEPESSVQE